MNEHEPALELFRRSCGLSAPIQLESEHTGQPMEGIVAAFDFPFVLIGRHSRSDLRLDHGGVSRRHALLQAVAGRVFVVDLNSRSKVHWEGEEDSRSHGWFDHDRFIQVGPYRMRRRDNQVDADASRELPDPRSLLQAETSDSDGLPRASLELPIRTGNRPSQWFLESRLALVGRSDECQLVLTDDSISKFHAALLRTPSGVWVIDLLAREGTHVNGARVRWAWLGDGDALRLGRFTFVVRYETSLGQISRRDVPLDAGADLAAHVGTELAVRTGDNGHKPPVPAVRSSGRSRIELKALSPNQPLLPSALFSSTAGAWEPEMIAPPAPMGFWQHQMRMMELFHNDMMMMFQMFVAMHGEHLASVRDELGRFQQLTRELNELQAKLAQPAGSADAGPTKRADRSLPKSAPGLPANPKKLGNTPASRDSKHAGDRSEAEPRGPVTASGASKQGAPAPGVASPSQPDRPAPADQAQVHEVLTRRIAELQRERQGYWQRILSALNN
jgi:pSer/pThr/pTyr-binding forkhead associated (FHA) protein